MLQDEQIGRADAEHDDRMAVEAIAQPAPSGQREIFAHGQGVDIADAAMIEIAGARVMDRMRASPEVVGRQCQDTEDAADPVIGNAMAEESAMAAIMLDHEQAHEKARSRNRQQQAEPVAEVQGCPDQNPEQNKADRS